MTVLKRSVSVFFVLVALVLVYAVLAAVASDEGARAGVAVGYIVGAIVLGFLAAKLWRRPQTPAGTA